MNVLPNNIGVLGHGRFRRSMIGRGFGGNRRCLVEGNKMLDKLPFKLTCEILGQSTTSIVSTCAKAVDSYRRQAIRMLENYNESKTMMESDAESDGVASRRVM